MLSLARFTLLTLSLCISFKTTSHAAPISGKLGSYSVKAKKRFGFSDHTSSKKYKKAFQSSQFDSVVPESIRSVIPANLIAEAGFTDKTSAAQLANSFFNLYNLISDRMTGRINTADLNQAQYFALLMSAFHLEKSIEDSPMPSRASLYLTQAQIKQRAFQHAPSGKARNALMQQQYRTLSAAEKNAQGLTDENARNTMMTKIDRQRRHVQTVMV